MSNALNRNTLEYRQSVDATELPGDPSEWVINPVLPDCERRWWISDGDTIREMTEAEKLPIHRADKLRNLNQWYAAKLADGVPVGGLTLKAEKHDQDRLTSLATVCNTGLLAQVLTADSPCPSPVWDASGTPHTMTVGEFSGLALLYAQAVAAIETQWQSFRDQIATAASKAELDAITLEVTNG
jgi:hypothetical protein